jgi:hypothetical protein
VPVADAHSCLEAKRRLRFESMQRRPRPSYFAPGVKALYRRVGRPGRPCMDRAPCRGRKCPPPNHDPWT